MVQLSHYINKISEESFTLEKILEFVGDHSFTKLKLVPLLVIHYLLRHCDIELEPGLIQLIDLVHIEIMERLIFVPDDQYAETILRQEKPYLELRHLQYAKLLLLEDFEQKLKIASNDKMSAASKLLYGKLVDLFCYITKSCLDPVKHDDGSLFTIHDLEKLRGPSHSDKIIYFIELENVLKKELDSIKFFKNLSSLNTWDAVNAVLRHIQKEKIPLFATIE